MGKFESHGASSNHSQVAPRTSDCIGLISNTDNVAHILHISHFQTTSLLNQAKMLLRHLQNLDQIALMVAAIFVHVLNFGVPGSFDPKYS